MEIAKITNSIDFFWDYWYFYPRGIIGRRWAKRHLQTAARLWPQLFHLHPAEPDNNCPDWCPFFLNPSLLHSWRPIFTSRLLRYKTLSRHAPTKINTVPVPTTITMVHSLPAPIIVNALKSDAHNRSCLHLQQWCQCRPVYVGQSELNVKRPHPVAMLERHLPACLAQLVLGYEPSFGLTARDLSHLRALQEYKRSKR